MVCRNPQWLLHSANVWGGISIGYLYMNRFAELMVPRPGAGAASRLLAALLAPLAWAISAGADRRSIPMREHGMEPGHGFARSVSSCLLSMLPDGFYDKVKEGSVVFARSRSFVFCHDGLVLDGAGAEKRVVPADVVESCAEWGRYYARRSGGGGEGQRPWRPCLGAVNVWYNDELCRDMGCDPRRKRRKGQGLLAEWFQPYGAVDYADIQ
uniref:Uncharacterized protein n=1 Tax=Aegilops tauschii TaxID=37682 RepID=M8BKT1_AEGTA